VLLSDRYEEMALYGDTFVFPPKGHSRQIKRGSVNTEQSFGIPGDPMVSCPAQLEEYLANNFKDHCDEIGTLPGGNL
jgi:hypothetical protein